MKKKALMHLGILIGGFLLSYLTKNPWYFMAGYILFAKIPLLSEKTSG